jgi:hypothetical protein
MNADLFKSFLLLIAFFYLSGSGFVVSLLPAKWWRGIWSIVLFPVFGVLIHIVFSGILIPRGITIQFSTILVIIASVLILSIRVLKTGLHNAIQNMIFATSRINLNSFALGCFLMISALLPLFFIRSNSVMNVRLGIDAALYADGAQSLLANENQPNLSNVKILHPGSLSAALFFDNFRWGTAFLMAVGTLVTGSSHSLSIGVPLFAMVIFVIGGLTIHVLSSRKNITLPILMLAVAATTGNTFFVRLLTEGQWPNLIAILFTILLIHLTIEQYSNFEISTSRVRLNIASTLVLCAILFTYAEILPLLMAIITFTHIISSSVYRKNQFLKSIFLNATPTFFVTYIYFALSNPSQLAYFKFLVLPSYSNVGYQSPRATFPTDLLGLTDIWASPMEWLSFNTSVQRLANINLVSFILINCYLVLFVSYFIWKSVRVKIESNEFVSLQFKQLGIFKLDHANLLSVLTMLALVSLLIYSWLSSQLVNKSDYLLIKASSILLIPIAIEALSLIAPKRNKKIGNSNIFVICLVLISMIITSTNIQNLASLKYNSTPLLAGNLNKPWDAESKLNCGYVFNKRGHAGPTLRYVDRTVDYYMASVFRNDVLLDPWLPISLVGNIEPESVEIRNVCIAFRSPFPPNLNIEGFEILFENEYWKVFDTGLTFSEAISRYQNLESFLTAIQK